MTTTATGFYLDILDVFVLSTIPYLLRVFFLIPSPALLHCRVNDLEEQLRIQTERSEGACPPAPTSASAPVTTVLDNGRPSTTTSNSASANNQSFAKASVAASSAPRTGGSGLGNVHHGKENGVMAVAPGGSGGCVRGHSNTSPAPSATTNNRVLSQGVPISIEPAMAVAAATSSAVDDAEDGPLVDVGGGCSPPHNIHYEDSHRFTKKAEVQAQAQAQEPPVRIRVQAAASRDERRASPVTASAKPGTMSRTPTLTPTRAPPPAPASASSPAASKAAGTVTPTAAPTTTVSRNMSAVGEGGGGAKGNVMMKGNEGEIGEQNRGLRRGGLVTAGVTVQPTAAAAVAAADSVEGGREDEEGEETGEVGVSGMDVDEGGGDNDDDDGGVLL